MAFYAGIGVTALRAAALIALMLFIMRLFDQALAGPGAAWLALAGLAAAAPLIGWGLGRLRRRLFAAGRWARRRERGAAEPATAPTAADDEIAWRQATAADLVLSPLLVAILFLLHPRLGLVGIAFLAGAALTALAFRVLSDGRPTERGSVERGSVERGSVERLRSARVLEILAGIGVAALTAQQAGLSLVAAEITPGAAAASSALGFWLGAVLGGAMIFARKPFDPERAFE